MRFSIRRWSVPLTALIALTGVNCLAEGIVDPGIVGGLADMGDMEPLANVGSNTGLIASTSAHEVNAGVRASARQSVPVRDRSTTYRTGELFRHSKVALPLIVADLEPRVVATAQPMSGRSVGARPAAAWTRTSITPAAGR
ncbi:MAG: hypothetical protein ACKO1M_02300 [Planctomycetota bacterium]